MASNELYIEEEPEITVEDADEFVTAPTFELSTGVSGEDTDLVLQDGAEFLDNDLVVPAEDMLEIAGQPSASELERVAINGLHDTIGQQRADEEPAAIRVDQVASDILSIPVERAEDQKIDLTDPSKLDGAELDTWLREHTYPFAGVLAVELKDKIREQVDQIEAAGQKVDFGETTLDIGSRDGRYAGAIRSFGPKSVIAVDPSRDEIQKGMDNSFIRPGEAFMGTATEYATKMSVNETPRYDSMFVLNISPSLARDQAFIHNVMGMVKPGGWVVFSSIEERTYLNWFGATSWPKRLTIPDKIYESSDDNEKEMRSEESPEFLFEDSEDGTTITKRRGPYDGFVNGYLIIFRRTYEP